MHLHGHESKGVELEMGDIDPTLSECLIDGELGDKMEKYGYSRLDQVLGDEDAHVSGNEDALVGLEDGENPDNEFEYREL